MQTPSGHGAAVNAERVINRAMWEACRASNADIERRLLAGENRIEVVGPGGHLLIYQVPSWRERPARRLRIEAIRCRRSLGLLFRAAVREACEHPAIIGAIVMRPLGYRWDPERHRWVDRAAL